MNSKQRKQVASWVGFSVFLTIAGYFNNEILANWDILKWPSLIVIVAIACIFKPEGGYKPNHNWASEIVEKYPVLKLWFVIYVMGLSIFIYDSLSSDRDLHNYMGGNWVAVAIIGLVLPAFIAIERDRFKSNGD